MEVHLNSIEMGQGIYGAEAAAKYKFHTTAAKLTARTMRIDSGNTLIRYVLIRRIRQLTFCGDSRKS